MESDRQFSLKSLLKLTTLCSLWLGAGVLIANVKNMPDGPLRDLTFITAAVFMILPPIAIIDSLAGRIFAVVIFAGVVLFLLFRPIQ